MAKISELVSAIHLQNLVLPEFQREYVWTQEQAKQLIVSLFRGYPTGSLLFWKTKQPPELKNTSIPQDTLGTTSVILDGQQRLTTLYLLIKGMTLLITSSKILKQIRAICISILILVSSFIIKSRA